MNLKNPNIYVSGVGKGAFTVTLNITARAEPQKKLKSVSSQLAVI